MPSAKMMAFKLACKAFVFKIRHFFTSCFKKLK